MLSAKALPWDTLHVMTDQVDSTRTTAGASGDEQPVTAPADSGPVEDLSITSPEDERVAQLMEGTIDVPVLAEAVAQQEAADAADTLEDLEEDEAATILELMEDQAAADALSEMEMPLAAGVVEDLLDEGKADYAAAMLHLMAPDDAADLLQFIGEDERDSILRLMPVKESAQLRHLIGYPEDTAAGMMTTDFLALHETLTVNAATEAIRASELPVGAHHLPVISDDHRLVGIIGFRRLLLSRSDAQVADLMHKSVKAIRADLDQEEVAREFDRYDFFMLPVVDDEDHLLGIVTVDDVIDIIRAEQTEDVQKTVGAGAGEAVYSGLIEKFRGRFPWLVTSLIMTCGAVVVVLFFEDLIREHPILAFLMPVIAALVGNAGHQALAVTLRGIVLDEVRPDRVAPLLFREGLLGLLQGATLGLMMLALVAGLSTVSDSASWRVGAIAGVALTVSMAVGTFFGSSIPLIMRRLGFDPAQSSAIFLIMVTDGLSFSTFLGLTKLASHWFLAPSSAV